SPRPARRRQRGGGEHRQGRRGHGREDGQVRAERQPRGGGGGGGGGVVPTDGRPRVRHGGGQGRRVARPRREPGTLPGGRVLAGDRQGRLQGRLLALPR